MTGKTLDRYCGAKTRPGAKYPNCRRPAGWGTPHPGAGRCKLHGGSSLIKSGRYSQIKRESLRSLIAQHEADPDPLNTLPELAAVRALFQDFIERYDEFVAGLIAWHESFRANPDDPAAKPVQVLDVADAVRMLAEVSKIVERIQRARAANAISLPDLIRVMTEMGRVVEAHVKDERAREQIRKGWLSIPIV